MSDTNRSTGSQAMKRRQKANTTVQRIARVYAKSLFQAGQSAGRAEAFVEEMEAFVLEVLDSNPQFEAVLTSARVDTAEKEKLLEKVLGGKVSDLLLNSLKVIARHERLNTLRAVVDEMRELYDKSRGHVQVKVGTAVPIDDALAGRITEGLRRILGSEPDLVRTVNPDLLGGLVVRVGDTVFDGSISTELERLREQLIHRSVHEIQSGRDRFSHSEGN